MRLAVTPKKIKTKKKLKNHFNISEILYEFCHLCSNSTENVETEYQNFVKLNQR